MKQQTESEAPIPRAGETKAIKSPSPPGRLNADSIRKSPPSDRQGDQERAVEGSVAYRVGAMIAMILLAVGTLVVWYYFR